MNSASNTTHCTTKSAPLPSDEIRIPTRKKTRSIKGRSDRTAHLEERVGRRIGLTPTFDESGSHMIAGVRLRRDTHSGRSPVHPSKGSLTNWRGETLIACQKPPLMRERAQLACGPDRLDLELPTELTSSHHPPSPACRSSITFPSAKPACRPAHPRGASSPRQGPLPSLSNLPYRAT